MSDNDALDPGAEALEFERHWWRRGDLSRGIAALEAHLRALLLPYRVPVHYVVLDAVPRTTSMKPALTEIACLFAEGKTA